MVDFCTAVSNRYVHTVYALKCLLDPDTPNNEGCTVPFTDDAPLGSILNPEPWTAGPRAI